MSEKKNNETTRKININNKLKIDDYEKEHSISNGTRHHNLGGMY